MEQRKKVFYKAGIVLGIFLGFALVLSGVLGLTAARATAYQEEQAECFEEIRQGMKEFYEDYGAEVPFLKLEKSEIERLRNMLPKVKKKEYIEELEEIGRRLGRLEEYVVVKERLEKCFQNGVLKTSVSGDEIAKLEDDFGKLGEGYRKPLAQMLAEAKAQHRAIKELDEAVWNLLMEDRATVKLDTTRAQYKDVLAKMEALPQREVTEKYVAVLKKVDEVLTERERAAAEAAARAAEARRRAEELRKRREQEVAAAWRTLSVPYWSQNYARIYNGCEAASLLMALQFKGQLGGMDLNRYVELMPKSDNPFEGFTHSIYDFEPRDVPHWIAPDPLARFGRESSGYQNVTDITGASLDDLDREIAAGNPVVIYVTWLFKPITYWAEGAPKNLHVVLLTGYNEATGTQRLTDPWTQADGSQYWDVPKAEIEAVYNAVGRRAVVVR